MSERSKAARTINRRFGAASHVFRSCITRSGVSSNRCNAHSGGATPLFMYVFIIEAVELSDESRTHLSAYGIMISFCRQKVREYSDEYVDGSNTMPMSFMFFRSPTSLYHQRAAITPTPQSSSGQISARRGKRVSRRRESCPLVQEVQELLGRPCWDSSVRLRKICATLLPGAVGSSGADEFFSFPI